jgi:hypothetical protein
MYTPPFDVLSGPTTLGVHLNTTAENQWVGVNCALINETTGDVREFAISTEYWAGYTDGESWTEGSRNATEYLDSIPAGRYSMRLEPSWEGQGLSYVMGGQPPPQARVWVRTRERSSICCFCTFLFLLLPLPIVAFRRARFERKRWSNSNLNTIWNQQFTSSYDE